MLRFLVAAALITATSADAQDNDCAELSDQFSKYDKAARWFDRAASRETSAARAALNQQAITNILLRQSVVIDIMSASGCDMPPPPDFPVKGFVDSRN